MTTSSCFNLVSFVESHFRKTFTSSGLSSKTLEIDYETIFHFWSPINPSKLPPLILIHGFGANPLWQWSYQIKSLSTHFSLYIPDLISFGKSTTNSSERSEIFQAISIVKLVEKLGINEKYSIMGTSYGGFVAYHIARLWPEKIKKVIIASSAINMKPKDNLDLLKKAKVDKIEDFLLPFTTDQLRTLIGLCTFKRPFYIPDFFLKDFLTSLFSENREEKIQFLKGITLGMDDAVHISPLQQEVLIVWGKHDQIFPLERGYELKELIGDKVRMEVLEKTGHIPQIENPKLFNSIIKEFLFESSSSL